MAKTKGKAVKKFDDATVRELFGYWKAEELTELIEVLRDLAAKKVARRKTRKK